MRALLCWLLQHLGRGAWESCLTCMTLSWASQLDLGKLVQPRPFARYFQIMIFQSICDCKLPISLKISHNFIKEDEWSLSVQEIDIHCQRNLGIPAPGASIQNNLPSQLWTSYRSNNSLVSSVKPIFTIVLFQCYFDIGKYIYQHF